jgi:predicted dehydrogenase
MPKEVCRFGILGAAEIAQKNWRAIADAGNARLVAVASRSADRAEKFVAVCQSHTAHSPAPIALGSYEALLARDDIDAVYIPLPTGVRKEWVIRAAEAGKHVLCEKPCAVSSRDLVEMLEACRRNKVQFMDGVMFMHGRRLASMRKLLDEEKEVGAVRRIASQFSFRAPAGFLDKNIRASSQLEPLGCLGDLGWYCVRLALWAMNYEMPSEVTGRLISPAPGRFERAGAPMEFSAELLFQSGATASFYCSFVAENQQWAMISGERGCLRLSDFVLPFAGDQERYAVQAPVFDIDRCDFVMTDRTKEYAVDLRGGQDTQEANMIRTFSRIVQSGELAPVWGDIALQTQQVIDACLASAKNGGACVTPGSLTPPA